ncbi:MAG: hypothetical protein V4754_02105 [Pseudomonadota bacterium]
MPQYIVEVSIKDDSADRTFTWQGDANDEAAAMELAQGAALEDENARGARGMATVEVISIA